MRNGSAVPSTQVGRSHQDGQVFCAPARPWSSTRPRPGPGILCRAGEPARRVCDGKSSGSTKLVRWKPCKWDIAVTLARWVCTGPFRIATRLGVLHVGAAERAGCRRVPCAIDNLVGLHRLLVSRRVVRLRSRREVTPCTRPPINLRVNAWSAGATLGWLRIAHRTAADGNIASRRAAASMSIGFITC